MKSDKISRIDYKLRKYLTKLPPELVITLYSKARPLFLKLLQSETPKVPVKLPKEYRIKLWDIDFACCIFNAAGMFKDGRGYNLAASQGAGAFLAGTTTSLPRDGNEKDGKKHPFVPYHSSKAASNWMGLPNEGHAVIAKLLSNIKRLKYCPIGASIAASPEQTGKEALDGLIDGLKLYQEAAVDFIELNESCPNVPHETETDGSSALDEALFDRLEHISRNFLKHRKYNLPVILKLSNDTSPDQVPPLLDALFAMDFDGINFGNTSTQYSNIKDFIFKDEQKLYEYFTRTFGGGISGMPLKKKSLELAAAAVDYVNSHATEQEFHIIRTGGIFSHEDLDDSRLSGIKMNQWFTGYFENFARFGNRLYKNLLDGGG